MHLIPQRTTGRLLALAFALAGTGLLSLPGDAWAGCCKTLEQRHNVVSTSSSRPTQSSLQVGLALDGILQGPPDASVTVGQMYGAILIPNTWSGVSVGYTGTCTVSMDGDVVATLDSEDPGHVQDVMDDFGVPHPDEVVKPEWHPDASVAAKAQLAEPAPAGFHWQGFSSDAFDITQIPDSLMTSRIDGAFTTTISIANAPKQGPVQLVIRGGDEAEGIDTVRVPVFVDVAKIKKLPAPPPGPGAAALRPSSDWSIYGLAGLAALFGVVLVARRGRRTGDDA